MQRKQNIMVCVTQQKTCERLILSGHKLIKNENDKLYVIHVVNEKDKFLNNSSDGDALEYLFRVSKEAGAELTVIRSKDVIKAISDFATKREVTDIVMGVSPDGEEFEEHPIAFKLKKMLPNLEFVII
ncbi:universal stress protein [Abyssisolibacter fermentans]|uniref:universal stress protein n=1 Tax=Abyssisolibacter fermentans TaxID=1766203 RepID=UPI0008312A1C|nr:universal stress protein [Abyssisolibacter fermentans]